MNYILVGALIVIMFGMLLAYVHKFSDDIPRDMVGYGYVVSGVNLYTFYPYMVICHCTKIHVSDDQVHTILIEKKRESSNIFDSDVAEISLCAWVCRANMKIVEDFGYIVIENTSNNERCTFRVSLYTEAVCLRLLSIYFKK